VLAPADWRRRISAGGSFLAYLPEVDAGAPVGIVAGVGAGPGVIELISAWVRPQARGRGVGEALVGAVVGWARTKGMNCVRLWVTKENGGARRLHERCGFTPTGERQPSASGPGADRYRHGPSHMTGHLHADAPSKS
jgi:ribosomal protein S18 acetylase RimI-like enzyme